MKGLITESIEQNDFNGDGARFQWHSGALAHPRLVTFGLRKICCTTAVLCVLIIFTPIVLPLWLLSKIQLSH